MLLEYGISEFRIWSEADLRNTLEVRFGKHTVSNRPRTIWEIHQKHNLENTLSQVVLGRFGLNCTVDYSFL